MNNSLSIQANDDKSFCENILNQEYEIDLFNHKIIVKVFPLSIDGVKDFRKLGISDTVTTLKDQNEGIVDPL